MDRSLASVSLFLMLVAQHWLSAALGFAAVVVVCAGIVPHEDRANLAKFGEPYTRYMCTMPALNLLAGVARWLTRRRARSKEQVGHQ